MDDLYPFWARALYHLLASNVFLISLESHLTRYQTPQALNALGLKI